METMKKPAKKRKTPKLSAKLSALKGLKFLKDMGFIHCGKFRRPGIRRPGKNAGKNLSVELSENITQTSALYAFVAMVNTKNAQKILYVGKSIDGKTRINQHCQNINADKIRKSYILKRFRVDIWILPRDKIEIGKLSYSNLFIDWIGGIEQPLINKLAPKWNKTATDDDFS